MCFTALQKSESDVRAMKKQAENLTVEYDRLLDEHSKLLVTHTHTHTAGTLTWGSILLFLMGNKSGNLIFLSSTCDISVIWY